MEKFHIHWYKDDYPYHGIFDSPAEMIKSLNEVYSPAYFLGIPLYLIVETPYQTINNYTAHKTTVFTCTFDGQLYCTDDASGKTFILN